MAADDRADGAPGAAADEAYESPAIEERTEIGDALIGISAS